MLLHQIREAFEEYNITWEEDKPIVIRTNCKEKTKIPLVVENWTRALTKVSCAEAVKTTNSIYISFEEQSKNIYINIFPTTGTVMLQETSKTGKTKGQWLYKNAQAIKAELNRNETTTVSSSASREILTNQSQDTSDKTAPRKRSLPKNSAAVSDTQPKKRKLHKITQSRTQPLDPDDNRQRTNSITQTRCDDAKSHKLSPSNIRTSTPKVTKPTKNTLVKFKLLGDQEWSRGLIMKSQPTWKTNHKYDNWVNIITKENQQRTKKSINWECVDRWMELRDNTPDSPIINGTNTQVPKMQEEMYPMDLEKQDREYTSLTTAVTQILNFKILSTPVKQKNNSM